MHVAMKLIICILMYVPLCVGRSKASAGQYFLYCLATKGNISIAWEGTRAINIAQEGGFFDPHFDL